VWRLFASLSFGPLLFLLFFCLYEIFLPERVSEKVLVLFYFNLSGVLAPPPPFFPRDMVMVRFFSSKRFCGLSCLSGPPCSSSPNPCESFLFSLAFPSLPTLSHSCRPDTLCICFPRRVSKHPPLVTDVSYLTPLTYAGELRTRCLPPSPVPPFRVE